MRHKSNDLTNNESVRPNKSASAKPQITTGVQYRLWRSFKLVSRTLIYIPLGLLITFALLIGTHIGSRFTVLLADTLVPDLQLTYVDGTINDRLEITDVRWHNTGVAVELDDVTLDWQPLCLLRKQLCIGELLASSVIVEIDTDPVKQNIQEQPIQDEIDVEITLAFGIDLTEADLANVSVRVDDMHFDVSRLQTRAQWQSTGIRVNYLTTQDLLVDIPLSRAPDEEAPLDIDQDNTWAMADLPRVFMPIAVFSERVSLSNSHLRLGHRDDFFSQIDFEASYHSFLIHIDKLKLEHTYGEVSLEGEISLVDDYPMDFIAVIDAEHIDEIPDLGPQHVDLQVSGDLNRLELASSGNGHIDYSLTGDIALTDPKLAYHLALKSTRLGWPLDTHLYSAQSVDLESHGDLDLQHLTLTGRVNSPYHPILAIDTQLTHGASQIDISHFHASGKLGDIDISGHGNYAQEISWDGAIQIIDFDMEQLALPLDYPLPESFISGRFNTRGKVQQEQWQVAISQSDLTGEIQGYPFHLIGDLNLDDRLHLSADSLTLSALQSILTIAGTADEYWAVDALLDVPDLSLWHPDASGSIQAKINVSGESDRPKVSVSAQAQDLQFASLTLTQAQINASYRPLDNQEFALTLGTGEFQYKALKLDSIALSIEGDEHNQNLQLVTAGTNKLDSQIDSTFNTETQQFVAEIGRLDLSSVLGDWELEAPVNVSWDNLNQTGLVSAFCWLNVEGKLCLEDRAELGANGDASIVFQGDIGAILAPLLPENLVWQAPAHLSSHLIWTEDTKPQGALRLDFEPGHLSLKDKNRDLDIGYKTLVLHASLDEKRLSTHLQFDSHDIAKWEVGLDIAVTPDRALSGYTKLHKINLHALADFLPQLASLQGNISSDITIAGTLEQPDISGKLLLEDGELLAAANPTLFEDISLAVSLSAQSALLDASWKMGQGQAKLTGNIDWSTGALNGNLWMMGHDLVVIQPPLAIINVSPDVNIIFNQDSFNITGTIEVPSGHIKIVQLPEGAVEVSKDVIFHDSLSTGERNQGSLALSSDITIKIYDGLIIDGMGLTGKLEGVLALKQQDFKPALLYGDIRVIDGKYKFMGQTLDIKAGEVQFIGPLEVPNLNIEAIRQIKDEDVIAGVRITGTPLKPIVTLFSSPAKEQAEILSYIIKGTGFRTTDNEQNSGLMLGAALTLSHQIGGGAVNNLGDSATGLIEKLGFSNVQLDANDDGRVAISGFIGEDLMVKYGYGVFNPGYEMTVRYYLLSQLYLESVSGTIEHSLDIYYNFDID